MRKFTFLILSFLLYLGAFCQEKKDQPSDNPYKFRIGAGAGIIKYSINSNETFGSQSNSIKDDAYENLKIYADYYFVRRFAIGIALESNGFFTKLSSFDSVSSFNFGIVFKYKFIDKEFNHLFFEISPLYSSISFKNDIGISPVQNPSGYFDEYYVRITGKGLGFEAALGWDHYFGDHFGLFLISDFTRLIYSNLEYPVPPLTYNHYPQSSELKYAGFGANLGIIFRI